MPPPPAPAVAYGTHPEQVANLHLPAEDGGPWPTVVLVHGGFWRRRWDRTTTTPLARDLAARGYAAWNVEYRRDGWPTTLHDVVAGIDALAEQDSLDTDRVVAVGHSAGGQLALRAAAHAGVRLRAVVSLAGVLDLVAGARANLGDGACQAFLGGEPDEVAERYAEASPAARLPLGVPQLLVHGRNDDIVPPGQSRGYAAAARAAGDRIELVEPSGADHFDVVEPTHAAWLEVVDRLPGLLG
ncbi:MAG TPA: alpha/beta fold hydrolase [Gaiellaceae bacterium]|nr:alpha/beta fold hydrolase [Gaiellaceae bacterium]